LKPANILVNEDCSVKLCDYGLARSITGVESAEMIIKNSNENLATEEDVAMQTS
jgi:mitogen-activated protein kinase 1/3